MINQSSPQGVTDREKLEYKYLVADLADFFHKRGIKDIQSKHIVDLADFISKLSSHQVATAQRDAYHRFCRRVNEELPRLPISEKLAGILIELVNESLTPQEPKEGKG